MADWKFWRRCWVSILVLLEEPLQLYEISSYILSLDHGFNPCFTGRTTSTTVSIFIRTRIWMFQSLFYWKNHFNAEKQAFKKDSPWVFQSLFYWKNHFNEKNAFDIFDRFFGFQSLFYWKNHFNRIILGAYRCYVGVSILVLLEEPLQRIGGAIWRLKKFVSILVLLEEPLQLKLILTRAVTP